MILARFGNIQSLLRVVGGVNAVFTARPIVEKSPSDIVR